MKDLLQVPTQELPRASLEAILSALQAKRLFTSLPTNALMLDNTPGKAKRNNSSIPRNVERL